jgi:starch synthase
MKKILFVGAEAMPFAATGGLGDVLGSLPAAIAAAVTEIGFPASVQA